jgi:putative ABC transport system ATP-binding protein
MQSKVISNFQVDEEQLPVQYKGIQASKVANAKDFEEACNLEKEEFVYEDQVNEEEAKEVANHGGSDEVIIRLTNVHKTYLLGLEGVPALRGVNLSIFAGEFVTILGTSGGGKTTMLNIIGTIDKPSKGDIRIGQDRIKYSTPDKVLASIRLNKLGFVFQQFNLIGSLTALENVELPMQLKGELSRSAIRKRASKLLHDVNLGERMDHFPNQLSGGEQQRVTIARAIANNPAILLLDEPTGDLDTTSTDVVMKILIDLNRKHGITMVMVTHDVGLKNFADRVVHMADGKIHRVAPVKREDREQICKQLDDRIDVINANIASGGNKKNLNIREGITE